MITYRQLKKMLDKVPDSQLDQRVPFNSPERETCGYIEGFDKARADLISAGDWSPGYWLNRTQLRKNHSDDQINDMDVQISKGEYFLTF